MSATAQGTSVPSVFQFDSQEVRIFVDDQGQPWFCAKDVCAVLGYINDSDAIKKHCREAGAAKRYLSSNRQKRELTFINEGNVHRLILKSHKPEAERVADWLCGEVLPAIRKTGRYEAASQSSDIHMHHSIARLDIELRADRTFTIRKTAINEYTAADMLCAMARATVEIVSRTDLRRAAA